MKDKRLGSFFNESVTRQEVMLALSDRRPSPLRRQGPRRLLVLCAGSVITLLAFTVFIGDRELRIYSEVILMVLGLILLAFVRGSVRAVSDAPDELLDERQIALRDANYKAAYHQLVWLTIVYGTLVALISPGGWLHDPGNDRFWTGIVWSFLLCGSSLPSMVLAWNMPSEPVEEPQDVPLNQPKPGPP